MPTCTDNQLTCWDGSCVDHLGDCPPITDYDYDQEYPYTGQFADDPSTPNFNEALEEIYLSIGGEDWTGYTFQEWLDAGFGDEFPLWEGSAYASQADLLLQQLGMLPEALRLEEEGFAARQEDLDLAREGLALNLETAREQTGFELEQVTAASESVRRATGGLQTGASEAKLGTLYQQLTSGFEQEEAAISLQKEGVDIDEELLNIAHESNLFDIESRRLDYIGDMDSLVQQYEDKLWGLIYEAKSLQEGPDDDDEIVPEETGCEGSGMVTCLDLTCAATAEECPGGTELVGDPGCPTNQCFCPGGLICSEACCSSIIQDDDDMDAYCADHPEDTATCGDPVGGQGQDYIEPDACPDGTLWQEGSCYGVDPDTGNFFCTGLCAIGLTIMDILGFDDILEDIITNDWDMWFQCAVLGNCPESYSCEEQCDGNLSCEAACDDLVEGLIGGSGFEVGDAWCCTNACGGDTQCEADCMACSGDYENHSCCGGGDDDDEGDDGDDPCDCSTCPDDPVCGTTAHTYGPDGESIACSKRGCNNAYCGMCSPFG